MKSPYEEKIKEIKSEIRKLRIELNRLKSKEDDYLRESTTKS